MGERTYQCRLRATPKMARWPAALLVAALACGWTQPSAASSQESEAARLGYAVVSSLVSAISARDRLDAPVSKDGAALTAVLTDYVLAGNRLRDAAVAVEPFLGAKNEAVRETAEAFTAAYGMLRRSTQEASALAERSVAAKSSDELNSLAPAAARLAGATDDAWRILPVATAALTHSLIDGARLRDGKLAYLAITSAEVAELRQRIRGAYPAVAAHKGGGHTIEISLKLLWDFLSEPWLPSDAKTSMAVAGTRQPRRAR